MLVLEQLMDKFAQFTFSNQPLLLILLAIVVTNVSFNFSRRYGNLEFIYLTILPWQRVAPITLGLP